MSIEDGQFFQIMADTMHQDSDGYVTTALPLMEKLHNALTKAAASHRFDLLTKKLDRDPKYAAQYCKFMSDILSKGDAELVKCTQENEANTWYIPHFAFYHPKKPNKIRVVLTVVPRWEGLA